MITRQKKKIIFAIFLLVYAAYNIFFYQKDLGFLTMVLFTGLVFSGFFLAEDCYKYVSELSYKKVTALTLGSALGLSILGVILNFPAHEAREILLESLARGLMIALIVFAVSKFRIKNS